MHGSPSHHACEQLEQSEAIRSNQKHKKQSEAISHHASEQHEQRADDLLGRVAGTRRDVTVPA